MSEGTSIETGGRGGVGLGAALGGLPSAGLTLLTAGSEQAGYAGMAGALIGVLIQAVAWGQKYLANRTKVEEERSAAERAERQELRDVLRQLAKRDEHAAERESSMRSSLDRLSRALESWAPPAPPHPGPSCSAPPPAAR